MDFAVKNSNASSVFEKANRNGEILMKVKYYISNTKTVVAWQRGVTEALGTEGVASVAVVGSKEMKSRSSTAVFSTSAVRPKAATRLLVYRVLAFRAFVSIVFSPLPIIDFRHFHHFFFFADGKQMPWTLFIVCLQLFRFPIMARYNYLNPHTDEDDSLDQ